MNKIVWMLLLLSVAFLSHLGGCGDPEDGRWKRLTKEFMACVPDTLSESRQREIAGLLDTFWKRAKMGKVLEEDVAKIETKLMEYAGGGWIHPDTLAHFMALVGYSSYRKDPRYNLPEGVVDHPTLNPDAAIVLFGVDSTGPRARIYYRIPEPDTTADTTTSDTTKTPSK